MSGENIDEQKGSVEIAGRARYADVGNTATRLEAAARALDDYGFKDPWHPALARANKDLQPLYDVRYGKSAQHSDANRKLLQLDLFNDAQPSLSLFGVQALMDAVAVVPASTREFFKQYVASMAFLSSLPEGGRLLVAQLLAPTGQGSFLVPGARQFAEFMALPESQRDFLSRYVKALTAVGVLSALPPEAQNVIEQILESGVLSELPQALESLRSLVDGLLNGPASQREFLLRYLKAIALITVLNALPQSAQSAVSQLLDFFSN